MSVGNWNYPGLAQQVDSYWHNSAETQFRNYIAKSLSKHIQSGNILEVGCGTGLIYEVIKNNGLLSNRKYIGGDSSLEMLAIAKKRYPEIEFKEINVLEIIEKEDNVLCIQVIQHLIDYNIPIIQLGKAARKLLYIVSWFSENDELSSPDSYGCYATNWGRKSFEKFVQEKLKPKSITWEDIDGRNWAVAIRMS